MDTWRATHLAISSGVAHSSLISQRGATNLLDDFLLLSWPCRKSMTSHGMEWVNANLQPFLMYKVRCATNLATFSGVAYSSLISQQGDVSSWNMRCWSAHSWLELR